MFKYFFITFVILGSQAFANINNSVLLSLNTIYIDRDHDYNGSKVQSKETDTEIRLMKVYKQWGVGGLYSQSSNDSSDASRTGYALTLGFYSEKDFYMNLHYFLSSKYNMGGGTEYTKGSGYGLDVGFISKITSSFYAGLVLTHRNYTYGEMSSPGGTTSANVTQKELLPLFTFAVLFQ